MENKLWLGVGVVGIVALIGAGIYSSGIVGPQFVDAGIDVRNTACEDISAARLAVATELGQRKTAAENEKTAAMDKASNDYWAKNQELEKAYYECSFRALTADPCKELSDKISGLYQEIMADFEAGKGFNEAKFNEREQAKKEYDDCVQETHKPEFYQEKEAQCQAELKAGQEGNLQARQQAEATIKAEYEQKIQDAERAHDEKQAILNAIEEKCNEPGQTQTMLIGPLTTAGSGAAIQSNSPVCTGVFPGNDPNLLRQISQLESQLQKAKAGGQTGGLFGSNHVQEALDRLREELRNSPRTCKVDADCGNTAPVCCSGTELARPVCSAGVCASEKTTCESPEICAGTPAKCVAPYQGAQQKDGVYITRTIPEIGSCSQNLQVLNLQQETLESARYAIVGNIPNWLHIDKPSGSLPGDVHVTYSCNTVQKFGPGTYTVNGSITVYNTANELINTIPFNVSITVTEVLIDAIEYNGKWLPTEQLVAEGHDGCGANHWHAARGYVVATDGSQVADPGPQCGYGKVSEKPVTKVPASVR